jgi:hypothetical protein
VTDHVDRLRDVVDQEAGLAMMDELRHGAQAEGDHRRTGGHGLDDREPEGLGEADEV